MRLPLDFDTTLPLVRVYFNQREDSPNVWSVDDGDQTHEITVSNVVFQGVARLEYSGGEKSRDVPVAWIELRSARIHRVGDSSELFIENSE